MGLVLQVAVLLGLIRLLTETERPLLCASIYAGLSLVLGLLFGAPFLTALLSAAIGFGYSFGWFWLLVRVGGGVVWFVVLVAGLLAPVLVRFALTVPASG